MPFTVKLMANTALPSLAGTDSQRALLLRQCPSVISIASVIIKKLKSSRTFMIGFAGFISRGWLLTAWGRDTHTY